MSDTPSTPPALTTREALTAYATMINTGDPSLLAPLLAPDFTYTSRNVLTDMVGKDAYPEFMAATLETMRNAGLMPMADLVARSNANDRSTTPDLLPLKETIDRTSDRSEPWDRRCQLLSSHSSLVEQRLSALMGWSEATQ